MANNETVCGMRGLRLWNALSGDGLHESEATKELKIGDSGVPDSIRRELLTVHGDRCCCEFTTL
jgi:hypothetical protein